MRFESYAQQLEDLFLYCALKDVKTIWNGGGFYIDVGANDPVVDSVTKFFYDKGWRGINVEPLPDKCAALMEMRPRDINLCVGLGKERDKLKIFEAGGNSTFSSEIAGSKPVNVLSNPQRLKKILTLSEIHERYCEPDQEIHFCKIDVEGFEREVLEGIRDWEKFRPWIFVMESTLPNTNIPSHEQWESILFDNDYIFAFSFGVNRYYFDMEKEYLAIGFQQINQFVAQNEIYQMRMQRVTFR